MGRRPAICNRITGFLPLYKNIANYTKSMLTTNSHSRIWAPKRGGGSAVGKVGKVETLTAFEVISYSFYIKLMTATALCRVSMFSMFSTVIAGGERSPLKFAYFACFVLKVKLRLCQLVVALVYWIARLSAKINSSKLSRQRSAQFPNHWKKAPQNL